MRSFIGLALLLATLAMLTTSATAQDKKKQQEKVMSTGTVKALVPGRLQITNSDGAEWVVALAPRAEVFVTGTATSDFLKPGMLVRFSGKFNKKGETVDPIKTFTVYTPRVDWNAQRRPQREEASNPALTEATKNLFKLESEEPKKPVKPMRPVKEKLPDTFDVASAGPISSIKNGKLQVRAPEAAFKIDIAEDATVNLDVSDYSLAKPGDRIEIEGYANPMDATQIMATKVTIRLTDTIGETKKATEKTETPETKE